MEENCTAVDACSRNILRGIYNAILDELALQEFYGETFDDPDIINQDLLESKDICNRLLTHDYFKSSEDIIEKSLNDNSFAWLAEYKWRREYNRNLREKQRDMRRLFKLIIRSSEDWC